MFKLFKESLPLEKQLQAEELGQQIRPDFLSPVPLKHGTHNARTRVGTGLFVIRSLRVLPDASLS